MNIAPQTPLDEAVKRLESDLCEYQLEQATLKEDGGTPTPSQGFDDLRIVLNALAKAQEYQSLYYDLLFSVGHVWEGEGRHETAKRYILEAEMSDPNPATERPRPIAVVSPPPPPAPSQ